MDNTGQYILVKKHTQRKGKRVRRAFHNADGLELMRELGAQYATKHGEDFLIVQVVEEISKPESEESPT